MKSKWNYFDFFGWSKWFWMVEIVEMILLVNQMLIWGCTRENWFLTSSTIISSTVHFVDSSFRRKFISSTTISSTIISSTIISSKVHFVESTIILSKVHFIDSSFRRQSLHLCIVLMINEVMIVMATILSLTILVFITIDNNYCFLIKCVDQTK